MQKSEQGPKLSPVWQGKKKKKKKKNAGILPGASNPLNKIETPIFVSLFVLSFERVYRFQLMHNAWKGPLCSLQKTLALISLRIRAGWSGPSLSAYRINGSCRWTENVQLRLHGCACAPSLLAYGFRAFLPHCESSLIILTYCMWL